MVLVKIVMNYNMYASIITCNSHKSYLNHAKIFVVTVTRLLPKYL